MWTVKVMLEGSNEDITEMTYLKEGDKWAVMGNVMAALDADESDVKWVRVKSINIEKV